MSPSEAQEYIAYFIDEVVMPRANPLPGVPPELRGTWSSADGWFSWIAVPSPVTEDDLDSLEKRVGAKLPTLFRAYFLYKLILDGDFSLASLPAMHPENPLAELESQIAIVTDCSWLSEQSFLPIGQDGNDGGPICFKTVEPTPTGDYPIYFADHERLGDLNYAGERRWTSFAELLYSIEADILAYDQLSR